MNSEKGFAFIETVVALALLGIISAAFLSGLDILGMDGSEKENQNIP